MTHTSRGACKSAQSVDKQLGGRIDGAKTIGAGG